MLHEFNDYCSLQDEVYGRDRKQPKTVRERHRTFAKDLASAEEKINLKGKEKEKLEKEVATLKNEIASFKDYNNREKSDFLATIEKLKKENMKLKEQKTKVDREINSSFLSRKQEQD